MVFAGLLSEELLLFLATLHLLVACLQFFVLTNGTTDFHVSLSFNTVLFEDLTSFLLNFHLLLSDRFFSGFECFLFLLDFK